MSTRCQIDFIVKWKDNKGKLHIERRRVYRHSDGYPEGVIGRKTLSGGEQVRPCPYHVKNREGDMDGMDGHSILPN